MVSNQKSSTNKKAKKGGQRSAADPHAVPFPDLHCPRELSPAARLEWNRIVGELIALGVLSRFDRGPLMVYCSACAAWLEALQSIAEYGAVIKSTNGFPVQSPYVSIANHHADVLLRIASEFGFTPASRSRIFSFSQCESMLLEVVRDEDDLLPPPL